MSEEVLPDTFTAKATSSTDALAEARKMIDNARPVERRLEPAVTLVKERDASPADPVGDAAFLPDVVSPRRARSTVKPASTTATVIERAGRKNVLLPVSVHDALMMACHGRGVSVTEMVLAALNRQAATLGQVFPKRISVPSSGVIPTRARTRRRTNVGEPTVPVTLYLDAVESAAVANLMMAVNAGSRSNLVTEALRLELLS